MPSNLAEVKQVVVVGKMEDGKFHSTEMMIKCPSRYDEKKKDFSQAKKA
jgi:cytochrome c-type biogenesis protein CcmE